MYQTEPGHTSSKQPFRRKMPFLNAVSYGPEIDLLSGQAGVIGAVLSTSHYLHSEGGFIAGLVDARLPDGPLQLRVQGLRQVLRSLAGIEGAVYAIRGNELDLGGKLTVNLAR